MRVNLALLIGFVLGVAASAVDAQPPCGDAIEVQRMLRDSYGEVLVDVEVVNGYIVETRANPATGSYSVLVYPEQGVACMIEEGYDNLFIQPMT